MINVRHIAGEIGKTITKTADDIGKTAASLGGKTKETITKSQQMVMSAIDQNGNGEVDIEDVIVMGLKIPGIQIDRESFLRKELQSKFSKEIIDDAVAFNPLHANIPVNVIDKLANEVIEYERRCVSGISTLLGMPGGMAMAATIPTDIVQYYGYMLRATQKLMYLYGFPAIDVRENGQKFDSETLNILIICLGAMYGVAGASNALKAMAKALATGVEKHLLRSALTKGTFYPIIKSVAKWFSVNMTKKMFAGFFKKVIPVAGGIIGGGITYLTFKPCCVKLQSSLQNTMLSNPDYSPTDADDSIINEELLPPAEDVPIDEIK